MKTNYIQFEKSFLRYIVLLALGFFGAISSQTNEEIRTSIISDIYNKYPENKYIKSVTIETFTEHLSILQISKNANECQIKTSAIRADHLVNLIRINDLICKSFGKTEKIEITNPNDSAHGIVLTVEEMHQNFTRNITRMIHILCVNRAEQFKDYFDYYMHLFHSQKGRASEELIRIDALTGDWKIEDLSIFLPFDPIKILVGPGDAFQKSFYSMNEDSKELTIYLKPKDISEKIIPKSDLFVPENYYRILEAESIVFVFYYSTNNNELNEQYAKVASTSFKKMYREKSIYIQYRNAAKDRNTINLPSYCPKVSTPTMNSFTIKYSPKTIPRPISPPSIKERDTASSNESINGGDKPSPSASSRKKSISGDDKASPSASSSKKSISGDDKASSSASSSKKSISGDDKASSNESISGDDKASSTSESVNGSKKPFPPTPLPRTQLLNNDKDQYRPEPLKRSNSFSGRKAEKDSSGRYLSSSSLDGQDKPNTLHSKYPFRNLKKDTSESVSGELYRDQPLHIKNGNVRKKSTFFGLIFSTGNFILLILLSISGVFLNPISLIIIIPCILLSASILQPGIKDGTSIFLQWMFALVLGTFLIIKVVSLFLSTTQMPIDILMVFFGLCLILAIHILASIIITKKSISVQIPYKLITSAISTILLLLLTVGILFYPDIIKNYLPNIREYHIPLFLCAFIYFSSTIRPNRHIGYERDSKSLQFLHFVLALVCLMLLCALVYGFIEFGMFSNIRKELFLG
ncbi:hypothetical protein NEFER03_1505 [Nematocida sp. LUAm3]|nr:hypothetical protein NEFER03_1505 [Nematocida sp. LUAm3]KAI5174538.1 hypothetical protein NEFER02_0659 [Nematocida sp. LUAm2]KAI5178056.1 hypothetical protein NEFER01_1238 [Nematocida sp. LUAm1]